MNSAATYNDLIVEIDSHSQDQQPNMTAQEDFYKFTHRKNSNSGQETMFI